MMQLVTGRMTYDGVMRRTCNFQARYFPSANRLLHACLAGATLYEILMAGQWSSPAFMKYLDTNALDRDLVIQAHVDESEEEREVD